MWKVIWNYNGREGGEKVFAKNYQAQSFAYHMIKNNSWCTRTEVKFVGKAA